MELQRYEMGDYCSGYVPNDDGEVCMSYDVQRLEESHKELLQMLKLAEKKIFDIHLSLSYHKKVGIRNANKNPDLQSIRAAIAKAEGEK